MGIPPGNQTYAGPLLEGTGYTVGIYLGSDPASTMAEIHDLGLTTFRTGAAAGLTYALQAADPSRIPGTENVYYQFRVWDNQGGVITSWAQVMAGGGMSRGIGVSDVAVFTSPLGGVTVNPPGIFMTPATLGIRSFQLTSLSIPEPSVTALGAFGLGALVLCRRNVRFSLVSLVSLVWR